MLSSSPSEGTPAVGSYGCTPQSLPKFQHPSHELLKENGFTQHVYHKYRRRCLNGRDPAPRGGTECPCWGQERGRDVLEDSPAGSCCVPTVCEEHGLCLWCPVLGLGVTTGPSCP